MATMGTAGIVLCCLAALIAIPVIIYLAYLLYQKWTNSAGATPEAKLQAFLQSLGVVQSVEEVKGNIDQIKAFVVMVVAQSTVMKVIDDTQQATILAAFVAIKTAVGSESVTTVKRS